MTPQDSELLATVALVHGIEAADLLSELFRAGDEDFARAVASASLERAFIEEKKRIDDSKRGWPWGRP